MSEAQIELGARAAGIEYHSWLDIQEHPVTPKLPHLPFTFDPGKETETTPDGRPLYLKRGGSLPLLRELDRATEKRSTIIYKLKNYKHHKKDLAARYGFDSVMLLFITTDSVRQAKIIGCIKEVFPDGCGWIACGLIVDHIKLKLTTAPVTTELFSAPFIRYGHPPFYLNAFWEVACSPARAA